MRPERPKKNFWDRAPFPLCQGLDTPPPLPLYRGLDPPMPVTKFLDVNERIYMILSFVPGEGLKVIESGFSGAACEQQTYFRSSLLSSPDNQKCVCCSQAVSGMAFFVSNTYFHCTKNWIYTNLLGANMVQKSVFLLANNMTWNILQIFISTLNSQVGNHHRQLTLVSFRDCWCLLTSSSLWHGSKQKKGKTMMELLKRNQKITYLIVSSFKVLKVLP